MYNEVVIIETEQINIEGDEKLHRSVRLTSREYDVVKKVFGGVQSAFDHALKEAEGEEGWLPSLPKRLVPAFRAMRDIALTRENHAVDSKMLRDEVMNYCNCQRRTAVRYLHDLKRRGLIYTFGPLADEHVHFIACCEEDVEKIKRIGE